MGRWRPLKLPLEPLRGCPGRDVAVEDTVEDVCGEVLLPAELGNCSVRRRGQSPSGGGAASYVCWTGGRLDLSVAGYREAGSAEARGIWGRGGGGAGREGSYDGSARGAGLAGRSTTEGFSRTACRS